MIGKQLGFIRTLMLKSRFDNTKKKINSPKNLSFYYKLKNDETKNSGH